MLCLLKNDISHYLIVRYKSDDKAGGDGGMRGFVVKIVVVIFYKSLK